MNDRTVASERLKYLSELYIPYRPDNLRKLSANAIVSWWRAKAPNRQSRRPRERREVVALPEGRDKDVVSWPTSYLR